MRKLKLKEIPWPTAQAEMEIHQDPGSWKPSSASHSPFCRECCFIAMAAPKLLQLQLLARGRPIMYAGTWRLNLETTQQKPSVLFTVFKATCPDSGRKFKAEVELISWKVFSCPDYETISRLALVHMLPSFLKTYQKEAKVCRWDASFHK